MPFGHFKYLRVPYRLSSISEYYDCCMADVFKGLQGFQRIVDDIVIYDSNITEHITHACQFLYRCADINIALIIDKCNPTLYLLAIQGYHIDQSVTAAISQYPTPTSCTDLHSFIRLVNQLSTLLRLYCYHYDPFSVQKMSSCGLSHVMKHFPKSKIP